MLVVCTCRFAVCGAYDATQAMHQPWWPLFMALLVELDAMRRPLIATGIGHVALACALGGVVTPAGHTAEAYPPVTTGAAPASAPASPRTHKGVGGSDTHSTAGGSILGSPLRRPRRQRVRMAHPLGISAPPAIQRCHHTFPCKSAFRHLAVIVLLSSFQAFPYPGLPCHRKAGRSWKTPVFSRNRPLKNNPKHR